MNKKKQEAHRQQLFTMAARLQNDLTSLRGAALRKTGGEESGSLSNAPLHLADLGSDSFEQEVAVGLLQNEQQTLGAISEALDRIDNGTFGVCEGCGASIPEERLTAVPFASRCVPCTEQVEKENGYA